MSEKVKILLAEDDTSLGTVLANYLKAKSFDVTLCVDGEIALKRFKEQLFDFIILDVMMPVRDGFSVAKEIRKTDTEIPILFLTAKSMKEDKLAGFDAGGDDYLTKPFAMEELLARINAILKRTYKEGKKETTFTIGDISYDYLSQTIDINGQKNKLTTKENELFYLLIKNQDEILDRNDALKHVWGDDNYFNGRSMDVYITKLRKYLSASDQVEIMNVHGKGFRLLIKK
ncbi:MAG: response regulator transcription factor [Crocinitomicaceae bacterium]|jgi:two-component system OmpR family response regulator|nr:response regulator transcription factor [Crocinitomicaceae bacterium]MBK6953571.1 response regulator transcription factor [Crocinitomicaceae bacterium]MBK9592630.1 response regulator transcription factor [Crocinitomicaceae bacterium]